MTRTPLPRRHESYQELQFDVFLCHNSRDKPEVKRIAWELKKRGLKPWLDEWELRPGSTWHDLLAEQIETIGAAAVFVGPSGSGPWQDVELKAFLKQFISRKCPVIPVMLPGVKQRPELTSFLRLILDLITWVDFSKSEPDPIEQLIWGITGVKPDASHEAPGADAHRKFEPETTRLRRKALELDVETPYGGLLGELETVLAGVIFPRWKILYLCWWCAPRGQLAELMQGSHDGDKALLQAAVRKLAQLRKQSGHRVPLLNFVNALAHTSSADLRAALEEWLEKAIRQIAVEPIEVDLLKTALELPVIDKDAPYHLQFTIEPQAFAEGELYLIAWLDGPGQLEPLEPSEGLTPEGLRGYLTELCDQILESLDVKEERLWLECFMSPHELAIADIDQWVIEGGETIGECQPVVVRPLVRHGREMQRLKKRWQVLEHQGAQTWHLLDPLSAEAIEGKIAGVRLEGQEVPKRLRKNHHVVCAVLTEPPLGRTLERLLKTGVGVVLWPRHPDSDCITTCLAELESCSFQDLPQQVLRLRDQQGVCGLSLLWDDPRRTLPVSAYRLRAPRYKEG